MENVVEMKIEDRIAWLTMNDADHFNCLSEAMCNSLMSSIDKAYASECVGIIITAVCKRGVWSAGHNIHELPTDGSDPLAYEVPMEQLLRKVQDIPIFAGVMANVAVSAATIMSQLRHKSHAPPQTVPLAQAMTGIGMSCTLRNNCSIGTS